MYPALSNGGQVVLLASTSFSIFLVHNDLSVASSFADFLHRSNNAFKYANTRLSADNAAEADNDSSNDTDVNVYEATEAGMVGVTADNTYNTYNNYNNSSIDIEEEEYYISHNNNNNNNNNESSDRNSPTNYKNMNLHGSPTSSPRSRSPTRSSSSPQASSSYSPTSNSNNDNMNNNNNASSPYSNSKSFTYTSIVGNTMAATSSNSSDVGSPSNRAMTGESNELQMQLQTKSGMRQSARLSLSQMGFRSIFEAEDEDIPGNNGNNSSISNRSNRSNSSGSCDSDDKNDHGSDNESKLPLPPLPTTTTATTSTTTSNNT